MELDIIEKVKQWNQELIERMLQINTTLIQEKEVVLNISKNGFRTKIKHLSLINYLIKQSGFSCDIVFKGYPPISFFVEIRSSARDEKGVLLFFPLILYSQDLDFYKQFIQPHYELSKNYGKGCLLKSKENQNFIEAKRYLKKLYIFHNPISFYCGCKIVYSKTQERLIPDPSCGYKKKSPSSEFMINWEHIMPAHRFGKDRECWQKRICEKEKSGKIIKFKGRNCCNEIDDCFNIMEGDVHNLVPTIYELNRDRKNYFFGEIPGEPREFGSCDFEVDHKRNIAEPRESIRGDIARTYLYMSWFYGIPLTSEEKDYIKKWNKIDPPDEAEKKMNKLKAQYQGNENPFISYYQ